LENFIFILLLVIVVIFKLFDLVLETLNKKARNREVPAIVSDIYDHENYEKMKRYYQDKAKLNFPFKWLSFILLVLFLGFNIIGYVAAFTQDVTNHIILETLVFFGIIMVIPFVLRVWQSYRLTFIVESKYGFNTSTKKQFVQDTVKRFFLNLLLGGGFIALIAFLYSATGTAFVVISFIVISFIMIMINLFYVKLFVPLFNTLTPLENKTLKAKIEALVQKEHYTIKHLYVMDASKRSKKVNAFFSGFFKTKTIVLFDTLIDALEDDEILAILAHEMAHDRHKDILKSMFTSFVQLFVLLGLFYLFLRVDYFFLAYQLDTFHLGLMMFIFMIVLNPLTLLLSIGFNYLSRKAEYKADCYAAKAVSKDAIIHALKVLSRKNYANLTPHEAYVFVHYSHPPVSHRIDFIKDECDGN